MLIVSHDKAPTNNGTGFGRGSGYGEQGFGNGSGTGFGCGSGEQGFGNGSGTGFGCGSGEVNGLGYGVDTDDDSNGNDDNTGGNAYYT